MPHVLSDLERLDLAAKAQATEVLLSYARIVSTCLAVFTVVLAIGSEASFYETLATRVMAVFLIVLTITLWLRWRYVLYLVAALFAAVGVGDTVFSVHSHTILGWTVRLVMPVIWVYFGYGAWNSARTYATVRSKGWEKERVQVSQWLQVLKKPKPQDRVVELPASFWKGAYCLLNLGNCWVMARFEKGERRRLLEYRVLDPGAVTFESPTQQVIINVGKGSIRKIRVPQEFQSTSGWASPQLHT